MTSLYQLTTEFMALSEKLHDSDLDEQTIIDTLEGESVALEVKLQNVGFVVINTEADIAQIDDVIARLQERKDKKQKHAKRMREYAINAMLTTGKSKIEHPLFCMSIRNNPESTVIDAPSQIPEEYMREIPARYEPDRTLIKKAIQDGFTVPGAHLTRTQSLSIK